MEFLANDLSVHRQFHDMSSFRDALGRLMAMRKVAKRFGREVYCHRAFRTVEAMPGVQMQQAIGRLASSERRATMGWLTNRGPFWDDLRQHHADEWLECKDDVVTDSAVGEAAFRMLHGVECGLVSVTPSHWDYSPVEVTWCPDSEGLDDKTATLRNWRDAGTLEDRLRDAAPAIRSWRDLKESSARRFESLTFAGDCFDPLLAGVPFAPSAAERFVVLLGILDRFACAFDADGMRTAEGHQIYQDYFTGGYNALFSDSSDSEKNKFRMALTFPNPNDPEKELFCTWHGKERSKNFRVHFSWPIECGKPVYVVYAGPKITKR